MLQNLPGEILEKICSEVVKSEDSIDYLRVRRSKGDKVSIYSRSGTGQRLNLRSLLTTSSKLRRFAQQWLVRESRFNVRSANFVKFPEAFGRANAALIEHLELEFSFTQKVEHERDWPGLLDMFSTDLPNLTELELSTNWERGRPPYPEHESHDPQGSLSREGQEKRSILRFAAFLVLRHPQLRRLIWPADSGPTFEIEEIRPTIRLVLDKAIHDEANDLRRNWRTMEKWADETRTDKVLCEDQILNTTAIRRIKNTDLANIPLNQFVIEPQPGKSKDNVVDSEVDEATGFYLPIDERGYKKPPGGVRQEWSFVTVDELIDICQGLEEKSWSTTRFVDMLSSERIARDNIAQKLKIVYAQSDELTQLLEESRQYRNSTTDGIDGLLDQLWTARDSEHKAQMRINEPELQLEEANMRADRECARTGTTAHVSKPSNKIAQRGRERINGIYAWHKVSDSKRLRT